MKMKKYLITAALAVAIGGVFVSCKDDELSGSLIEQKALAFDEAFVRAFGTPAPNHTWGFEKNETRSVDVNSNEWEAKGYNIPKPITQGERDTVMAYFRTTPNPISETVDIHNYFIQNVGYSDATYTAVDHNNTTVTITNPGINHMDWIFCGPGLDANGNQYRYQDGDEHINNFNASSGVIQHILYTGSDYFGFHESFGTDGQEGKSDHKYCTVNRNFVLRYIEHGGQVDLYVGLNYESGKSGEGWHIDPDAYFSDRVLKLVPGDGITPPDEEYDIIEHEEIVEVGRVFCEDLGFSDLSDIDYNDIVFDGYIVHEWRKIRTASGAETTVYDNHYAKVCLLAAGGTIPASVAGINVHNQFGGTSDKVMINTTRYSSVVNGAAITTHAPVVITDEDGTEKKFYGINSLNDIKVAVVYNNKVVELTNENGGLAPYKICVPIGTRWPKERANIGVAYSEFANYCQTGPEIEFWKDIKETTTVDKVTTIDTDTLWDDTATPSPFMGKEIGLIRHDVQHVIRNSNNGNGNSDNNDNGNGGNNDNGNGDNNDNGNDGNNGNNANVDEGTYLGSYTGSSSNLMSNSIVMNSGGANKIVTNKKDVLSYADRISVGSKISVTIQVTNRDWWINVGLNGYGGKDLLAKDSNTSSYTNGNTFTVEVTITPYMYSLITSNVEAINENWWSGSLLCASGNGCTLVGIYIN